MRYAVVGLGKLGGSMTAAIASRGHDVVGVDVDEAAVSALNAGLAPAAEPGLDELVREYGSRIRATTEHRDAVLASDISFVVVPTPSGEYGAFSLEYAAAAFREIGAALRDREDYHLVVLTSTVLPGATRHGLLPVLEAESGKRCGPDFGLCYSPEFIALGSVVRDFLEPDFTLVGEHDARAGALLEAAYGEILTAAAPCKRMSLENAELAKLALNTYVTTKIAFANTLADLCERIPGGDVDAVTGALGLDARIGARYLTGALGYGGPCFPRDNAALAFIARALGTRAELAETTDRANRAVLARLVERFRPRSGGESAVAVLGLAYKPGTPVVEESQSLALARELAAAGARVAAHDPLAADAAREALRMAGADGEGRGEVTVVDRVEEALAGAELVLVTTPDPAYSRLTAEDFMSGRGPAVNGRAVTIVDFWRMLAPALEGRSGIRYVPIGRAASETDKAALTERLATFWAPEAVATG